MVDTLFSQLIESQLTHQTLRKADFLNRVIFVNFMETCASQFFLIQLATVLMVEDEVQNFFSLNLAIGKCSP